MPELKTEEQLRQEIIEEYSFDETDERIDKILEIKKDRFKATEAKRKAQKEAEDYKKGKDYYKSLANPKGKEAKEANTDGVKTSELSLKDQKAILEAKIHSSVFDEVMEEINSYAKLKGIAVHQAVESKYIQNVISEAEETRKTAEATNTSKTRKGKGDVSGDSLHERFIKTGELPESDEDIKKLVAARYERKSK